MLPNPRVGRRFIDSKLMAAEFTLHLKVFTTALGAQLDLKQDWRADMGKHKKDSSKQTVRLYSRDDVWNALRGQEAIIQWVADGKPVHAAQARGGRPDQPEPPIEVAPVPERSWAAVLDPVFTCPFSQVASSESTTPYRKDELLVEVR